MFCSKIGRECPHQVSQDDNLVFVIMPFDGFKDVYDQIKISVEEIKYSCERSDKKYTTLSIWCDRICKNIRKAKYLIVDTTGRNPNVFYELGFAHALKNSRAILITQNIKEAPFDIADMNHIIYSTDDFCRLKKDIQIAIKSTDETIQGKPVKPSSAFKDWEIWRKKQIEEAECEESLGRAILHSIQPAFYYNEIDSLYDSIKVIQEKEISLKELKEALAVTKYACEYYQKTEYLSKKPSIGKLTTLKNGLSEQAICHTDSTLSNWIEVIRNDFLGLCLRDMAELEQDADEKRKDFERAKKSFEEALKSLDQIGKNNEEEQEILNLWRGYVYRNLGRVYDILNNKDRAKETLKKAFDSRNNVIKHMSLGMPDIINSQLELETSLAELDILECDPKDKENEIKIKRICEKLKERKPTIRPIVVWSIAIDQAIELVKKHKFDNCKEILKKLNVLKRTLTYGFPWEKNRT